MPYLTQTKVYPAVGKLNEVRTILSERIQAAQKTGLRTNLAITAFGADPSFIVNNVFADLAAADAFRDGPLAPSKDPAFQARMAAVTRQPPLNELLEVVLPLPPANGFVGRYSYVTRIAPLPAHMADALALVKSGCEAERAAGGRVNLSRVIGGEAGLRVLRPFATLADFEAWRTAAQVDANRQALLAKLTPMLAAGTSWEIREVIVAMP